MCIYAYPTHLVRSVMQISKYMSQFSGVKLLMGDFNDEPDSNAIRYVHVFMHITLFCCATPTIPSPIPLCVKDLVAKQHLTSIYVCVHLCVRAEYVCNVLC